jgi:hypothetical protein
VETEGQRCLLALNGCDEMQGYLFSRPVEASICAQYLQAGRRLTTSPLSAAALPALLIVGEAGNWGTFSAHAPEQPGIRYLSATSAAEAFEMLACNQTAAVIYDPAVLGAEGNTFASRLQQMYPGIACRAADDPLAGLRELSLVFS